MLGLMKNVQCCCCTALYMCHGFYHSNIIDFRHIPWSMVCYIAAVLNSSPHAPPLCIFHMLLLSHQMFVLFERKCPAKWTSQDIPPWFQFESELIYSIQSAFKCARCELKLYIFTEVYDVTLVRVWRRYAPQIHEWMFRNKVNFSGFPLLRE